MITYDDSLDLPYAGSATHARAVRCTAQGATYSGARYEYFNRTQK